MDDLIEGLCDGGLEGAPLGRIVVGHRRKEGAQLARIAPGPINDQPPSVANDSRAGLAELLRRRVSGYHHVEGGRLLPAGEVRKQGKVGIEEDRIGRRDMIESRHELSEIGSPRPGAAHDRASSRRNGLERFGDDIHPPLRRIDNRENTEADHERAHQGARGTAQALADVSCGERHQRAGERYREAQMCDIRPGERTDETHDRESERRTAARLTPDRTVRFQGDGRAGQKEGNRKDRDGRRIRPRREAPERDVLDAGIAVAREPDEVVRRLRDGAREHEIDADCGGPDGHPRGRTHESNASFGQGRKDDEQGCTQQHAARVGGGDRDSREEAGGEEAGGASGRVIEGQEYAHRRGQ
jgi:hypothetical protein